MPWRFDYRKAAVFGVLVLVVLFHRAVITSLLPFVLAFVLAAMIDPAVSFLHKRGRLPRGAAVALTLGTLIVVAGYALTFVLTKVAAELVDLAGKLPAYQRELVLLADEMIARLNELYDYLPRQVSGYLQSTIDDLSRKAVVLAADMIDRTLRTITGLPATVIVLIVTVLATYFLSKDREQLTNTLLALAPPRWRAPLRDAQEKILVDLIGFLKAQVIVFVITTSIAASGLYYIGTRFWMTLGIVLGILDVIPVLGPGLILFPWAALSLLMDRLDQAIQLVLLFTVILVIRQTAQAKVIGDSIGVHPLAMLIALYGGIVLFGVKGIIIGPVLVIVGKALWYSGLLSALAPRDEPPSPRSGEGGPNG